ncbi:hypothetical protein [Qipengyuania mesophila]|uniref:hypothetical protein n=1 Tax=Qipengyuania mesophila TaxID=2867246 RepID=UPI00351826FD
MKNSTFFLALGAAFMAALPASAVSALDQERAQIIDENDARADDPATIVCKRQPPPAGTRIMGKKVCKTNAAWRLEQEMAGDAARERQERSATGNTRQG